jgi:putative NADH-flavin reductase
MKFLVLGATGSVGSEIVKQALDRGHALTAFVRSPEPLEAFRDRITIVQGDLLNRLNLARVLEGQEVVLSAMGPRHPRANGRLLESFASALTGALLGSKVRRLVVLSVAFLFKGVIIPPAYLFGRLLFAHHVADAGAMEEIVIKSGLDWTIVRPPQFTYKPRTGNYRVREGSLPLFGFTISHADVADYMIRAAEDHSSSQKIVGISN